MHEYEWNHIFVFVYTIWLYLYFVYTIYIFYYNTSFSFDAKKLTTWDALWYFYITLESFLRDESSSTHSLYSNRKKKYDQYTTKTFSFCFPLKKVPWVWNRSFERQLLRASYCLTWLLIWIYWQMALTSHELKTWTGSIEHQSFIIFMMYLKNCTGIRKVKSWWRESPESLPGDIITAKNGQEQTSHRMHWVFSTLPSFYRKCVQQPETLL